MNVELFSYRIQQPVGAYIVRGSYDPGYGYVCNTLTTNGSWGGLYNALYELDPAYVELPDHLHMGMSVIPLDVPPEMLVAAEGFISLKNNETPFTSVAQKERIEVVKEVLMRKLTPLQREDKMEYVNENLEKCRKAFPNLVWAKHIYRDELEGVDSDGICEKLSICFNAFDCWYWSYDEFTYSGEDFQQIDKCLEHARKFFDHMSRKMSKV